MECTDFSCTENGSYILLQKSFGRHRSPDGAFLAIKYISRSPHLALAKSRGIQIRYCLIRSFIIIEYLSRTEPIGSLPSDGLSLKVKSRMAANLSLDIIWRAKSRHRVGARRQRVCIVRSYSRQKEGLPWDEEVLPNLDFMQQEWVGGYLRIRH